jgi:hypothetical protein
MKVKHVATWNRFSALDMSDDGEESSWPPLPQRSYPCERARLVKQLALLVLPRLSALLCARLVK